MTRSPNQLPGLLGGVVTGVVVAWLSMMALSYASGHMMLRLIRYQNDGSSLMWAVLIVVIAAVVGLLMSIRPIAAGVMIGAGLLWTVVSLALHVLPIRLAIDLSKLFEVPGQPRFRSSIAWDGSMLFVGVLLIALGASRLLHDARKTALRVQDTFPTGQPGQYPQHSTFPQQGAHPQPGTFPQPGNPQQGPQSPHGSHTQDGPYQQH
ncbi:hypothetical protein [Kribbella sp. NPDC023855]|uniref:hypothetical protein n=1 Tax=Kribbella sp. NPDC023855 TaxID=3154698 RepID=UPI0033C29A93